MSPPSVLDLAGVSAQWDQRLGAWQVEVLGAGHTVREWTWGERRRIVTESIDATGGRRTLDRDGFVVRLVAAIVDPPPQEGHGEVLAAVALRLLGVSPGQTPPSLLEAEATLAREWRWGPAELDGQPAPRLDEHLARLGAGTTAEVATGSWSSIVVVDDQESVVAAAGADLDRLLVTVEHWAGITPSGDPSRHVATDDDPRFADHRSPEPVPVIPADPSLLGAPDAGPPTDPRPERPDTPGDPTPLPETLDSESLPGGRQPVAPDIEDHNGLGRDRVDWRGRLPGPRRPAPAFDPPLPDPPPGSSPEAPDGGPSPAPRASVGPLPATGATTEGAPGPAEMPRPVPPGQVAAPPVVPDLSPGIGAAAPPPTSGFDVGMPAPAPFPPASARPALSARPDLRMRGHRDWDPPPHSPPRHAKTVVDRAPTGISPDELEELLADILEAALLECGIDIS